MPFPRSVIYEASTFLGAAVGYHGDFEDLVLRWELDQFDRREGAVHQRFRTLFRWLRDNPEAEVEGRLISDLLVEEAVRRITDYNRAQGEAFLRALGRAGFIVEDGQLRRTLPQALDLPAADDEVHALLERHGLGVPLGHLEQAIRSHGRADWAAANGQLRNFLESLLDEVAYHLIPNVTRAGVDWRSLARSRPAMKLTFRVACLLLVVCLTGCQTMKELSEAYVEGVRIQNGMPRRTPDPASAGAAASASPTLAPMSFGKLMVFGGVGHRTYLGCLNCTEYATDSMFNPYGSHGNQYSGESVLNAYGAYGSSYGTYSACNPYATDPPVIVDGSGNFYGRLTVNTNHRQITNDSTIRAWIAGVCQGG